MIAIKEKNMITIEFEGHDTLESPMLYQYDKGQKIKFLDVPDGAEVQFSNWATEMTKNKIVVNGQVEIPDILLQENKKILAYLTARFGRHGVFAHIGISHTASSELVEFMVGFKSVGVLLFPAGEIWFISMCSHRRFSTVFWYFFDGKMVFCVLLGSLCSRDKRCRIRTCIRNEWYRYESYGKGK